MICCNQFWFYYLTSISFYLKKPKILFILIQIRYSVIQDYIQQQNMEDLVQSLMIQNIEYEHQSIIGGKPILQKYTRWSITPKNQYLNMIQRDSLQLDQDWSYESFKIDRSICRLQSESTPQKMEAPIFALNQNQKIMIQHKLPKGYSLLPLQNNLCKKKRKQGVLIEQSLKLDIDSKKRGRPEGSSNRNQSVASLESQRKSSRLACVKRVKYNKRNWQLQSLQSSYISQGRLNSQYSEQENKFYKQQKSIQVDNSNITPGSLIQVTTQKQSKVLQLNQNSNINTYISKQLNLQNKQLIQPAKANQAADQQPIQQGQTKVITGPLFRVQISLNIPTAIVQAEKISIKPIIDQLKTSEKEDRKIQQSQKFTENFSQQLLILSKLKKHKSIVPFLQPVDEQRDGAPDYYKVIESPIDLQTIQFKLQSHIYKQPSEFHKDLQLMWSNSFIYNKDNQFMLETTAKLQTYYENLLGKRQRLKLKKNRIQGF